MQNFYKLSFLITSALVLSALTVMCADVHLVRDGQPVAEIVLAADANPSMQNAARDLQEFLYKISGAELPIVQTPTDKFENRIYAGAGELTKELGFEPASFTSSGYELLAKDNFIILSGYDRHSPDLPFGMTGAESQYLRAQGEKPENFPSEQLQAWWDFCGEEFTTWQIDLGGKGRFNSELGIYQNDDTGTWYAAVELLEQLGVRFFAPYEDGTVVPRKKDIAVPQQHKKSEATFARRHWYYRSDISDSVRWFKRLKTGNYHTIIYNHTTVAIYASRTQHEKHPEYLACDIDGKPFPRSYAGQPPQAGGVPRYTNPDFRRASVVLLRKLFDASPELYGVALGFPDGGAQVDPRDLELYGEPDDTFEQKAANYVWDYQTHVARELKKSHPGKYLIYQAPGGARGVPTNIKPDDPDNIIFGWPQSYSAYRVVEHVNREVLDFRAKWFAAYKPTSKSPIWDYYLYYRRPENPRFPVFFTKYLQEEMQEMQPYADGKFIELTTASSSRGDKGPQRLRICEPAIIHLMVLWQSRLFWDPNADREEFLNDYYEHYFGPAAAAMQEFHEFAEAVWTRQDSRSVTATLGFLKEPDVVKYFELLSRARARTESGSVYDRRIEAMEEGYSPLKTFFADIRRKGPLVKAEKVPDNTTLEDFLNDTENPNWMTLFISGNEGELPTENITRVRIAISADGKTFYLAAVCNEDRMSFLRDLTELNDAGKIFEDDLIELYLNTAQRSFFKLAVNPKGAIWDESQDMTIINRDTLPILWNPGTRAIARKFDDRWEAAFCFPTADLASAPPTKSAPWGIQVGRTRMAGEKYETYRLSPSSGRYAIQSNWADLWQE